MAYEPDDIPVNPSSNQRFEEVLAARLSRRRVLQHGLGAAALSFLLMAGILIAVAVYARLLGTEELTASA